ncbi:DNA polymerase III subunit gamma/tau [Rivibacter subsaxonicus]|uniref:DNA polymerase III subunit gamma/tau n=1 Tax=Rivibacter subsaxonicus TaxID=457575 RepID=A0A4Q7VNV4_9BURK|nr:DNA polymerase III subunit gamma/tau [Rivibacter subsaxonicus]RZT97808.1 DNA polymerase-3 subunit gamma/tau [Rivibacter subsaxonicus]
MSSLVLARKYRPKNFAQMVGQGHVVQALSNALASNRLHHAYLFTGTRGVGKTTVSRILAKSLNCTGPDGSGGVTATPCGVCEACRDIDAGRHVDYVELDAASNRGVDEISQLLDQSVYKPVVGRYKVYMIDEVHMLTNTAFNAMLKTLEEPPEYLKFVLATTDPQKVPVTVLSRCLQFNLRPMAPETVREHLAHVLHEEGIAAEPGALRLLARAARGSMRDALSLTDQAIAFGAGTLLDAGVREMLGAVDRSHVHAIVEALAAGDGAALVAQVDALRAAGLSAEGALEDLATLAQQMALAQALPAALDADDPDTPLVAELAARLPADETQLLYSLAIHGRAELPLAPDEHSGLTMVLLRALAFRPRGGTRGVGGEGTRAPRVQPAATVAAAPALLKAPAPPTATAAPVRAVAPRTNVVAPRGSASAPAPRVQPVGIAPWDDEPPAPPMSMAEEPALPEPGLVVLPSEPEEVRQAAPTEPVLAVAAQEFDDPLCARWTALLLQLVEVQSVVGLTRELGWQAQCTAFDEAAGVIGLRVERETLRQGEHPKKLQAALAALLGREFRLEFEAGAVSDTPQKRDAAARARRQREAEATIQGDPFVLRVMQQFRSARIVPGSIQPR